MNCKCWKNFLVGFFLVLGALFFCIGGVRAGGAACLGIEARAWPEADALFRSDPRWLGADDAYSVDLGQGRVLWLFGDTFVDEGPCPNRKAAAFIRNSVGLQKGYDPAEASIEFFWRHAQDGPGSFFPESGEIWFWPGPGVRLGDHLLVFLMKIAKTSGPLGFEAVGSSAVLIDNPEDRPSAWSLRPVGIPENGLEVIVGSAGAIYMEGFLYAFGAEETAEHDAFLIRWPVEKARAGDLSVPFWWTGPENGWIRQDALKNKPVPVIAKAQNEFTVHYQASWRKFCQVQTVGFGAAVLAFRRADELTGPWSDPVSFYQPEEGNIKGALVYAGKAHAGLTGADLVLTYVVNSLDQNMVYDDLNLYFPKFLKGMIVPGNPENKDAKHP